MRCIVLGFIALFLGLPLATAADLSSLYDRPTLEYWSARYKQSTNKIFDKAIWPVLFDEEKRNLGNKPVFYFPLYAEGKFQQHPLNFYADTNRNIIALPVFSLKFLDDLCTAYAWLQVKGYSLETVSEYTAILFYGEPPPSGFPAPLKALGIPESALKEPKVDELARVLFVTARISILLHEMGHILYGHYAANNDPDKSIRNEQQADRFAAEVIQRTALPPFGMLVWFFADAHWTGFPPQRGTHPMSGERVQALAGYIDDPGLGQQLRDLGKLLDDSEIRAGFVATGKAGDLAALAPRRPGELAHRELDKPKPRAQETLFSGVYRGEFLQFSEESKPTAIELVLERHGNHVTGHYNFGLGFGAITGRVMDDRLYFEWEWASNHGQGILEGRDDGSFIGTWGYRKARSGAGTWVGHPSAKSK